MPCKTGMTGCRRGCLHRQMVGEYRLAREAAVAKRDAECLGYETELEAYPPIVTFKKWLEDLADRGRDELLEEGAA